MQSKYAASERLQPESSVELHHISYCITCQDYWGRQQFQAWLAVKGRTFKSMPWVRNKILLSSILATFWSPEKSQIKTFKKSYKMLAVCWNYSLSRDCFMTWFSKDFTAGHNPVENSATYTHTHTFYSWELFLISVCSLWFKSKPATVLTHPIHTRTLYLAMWTAAYIFQQHKGLTGCSHAFQAKSIDEVSTFG